MREKRFFPVAWNSLKRAWHFLVRLDVAAVLIGIVLLVAVLGSCFPYLSPAVAADADRLARWEAGVRARYGSLTDLLIAGGAFRYFGAPVFLVPLVLLAVVTLACALDRWRGVWRRAFRRPDLCSDLVFEAAPHTASLTVPPEVSLANVVRKCLELQGFRVQSETAGDAVYLRGDRNRLAPLATLVNHLAVPLLLAGTVLSSGFGWREELTIGPGDTAPIGHGTGLTLRNERFAILRYPDGSVAAYTAEVALIEDGREVTRRNVQVNEPLTYRGLGFYLRGYGETEGGYNVTLLAVRDPGYGPVMAAGFLLLLGFAVIFYFPSCCVHARIGPDRTLHLAGRADRRAYDFEREFAALVKELGDMVETVGCHEA
jgi:cytochrome c biogenesis protein